MKLFNFKENKYRLAQTWINAYQVREAKKKIDESDFSFEKNFGTQFNCLALPETIFTQADKGHNSDEAKKIQEIYSELKNVALLPVIA